MKAYFKTHPNDFGDPLTFLLDQRLILSALPQDLDSHNMQLKV